MSVALGDAPHLPGTMALAAAGAAACGADYLKVGLFGSARPEQALELLAAVRRAAADVDPRTRLMAVGLRGCLARGRAAAGRAAARRTRRPGSTA